MACCLTTQLPEPMLTEVLCHSPEGNFTKNAENIYPWYEFENLSIWDYSRISQAGANELTDILVI